MLLGPELLESRFTPATLLSPPDIHDATLFSQDGTLSDGGGTSLYVGEVGKTGAEALRRALVEFDLSRIPSGSTITNATLTLDLLKVPGSGGGIVDVSVYPVMQSWGEGTAVSMGMGTTANAGDATWTDAAYSATSPVPWVHTDGSPAPGGAIVVNPTEANASATTTIDGRNSATHPPQLGPKSWSGPGLVADVQNWVQHPATNFGWLLKSTENVPGTALGFASREDGTVSERPTLNVTYTPPPSVTTTSLRPWTAGSFYSQSIQVTGGTAPYNFSTPDPIDGLTLSSSGTVSGIPISAGDFSFQVNVTDARAISAPPQTVSLHINPPPSLGNLSQNVWTEKQNGATGTISVTGGTTPYSDAKITGLDGLTATATGGTITISGAPASLASSITITVTDAAGATASHTYNVNVHAASPQTFQVNTTADTPSRAPFDPHDAGGQISLRSAIECAAADGSGNDPQTDTIIVPAGMYVLGRALTISGNMIIQHAPGTTPQQIQILHGQGWQSSQRGMLDILPDVTATIDGLGLMGASDSGDFNPPGAIDNKGTLTLVNSLIANHTTTAFTNEAGTASVSHCTFSFNAGNLFSGDLGGAILNFASLTISDSSFLSNTAQEGGAIDSFGTVSILNATFDDNSAMNGGAFENNGSLTIDGSTFQRNSVTGSGGAVLNNGDLTVSESVYSSNTGDFGGAIDNEDALSIFNSTFQGNLGRYGGALDNHFVLTVVNSTFAGNSASAAGGAIENEGSLTANASTVVSNSAQFGGAGISTGSSGLDSANLSDDILVDNFSDPITHNVPDDLEGIATAGNSRFNLVGADVTGSLVAANGNVLGATLASAGLLPLGYYGGATQTEALVTGSPAIGTGGAITTVSAQAPDPTGATITVSDGLALSATDLPDLANGSYFTIQVDGDLLAVTGLHLNGTVDTRPTATLSVTSLTPPPGGSGTVVHAAGAAVSLASDQRGLIRPAGQSPDIGAYLTGSLVNSTLDDGEHQGLMTLRDAVNLANLVTLSHNATIAFDPTVFAIAQTIVLNSDLDLSGPNALATIHIIAPESGLFITDPNAGPSGNVSGINVQAGGAVTLSGNLVINVPLDVAGTSPHHGVASLFMDSQANVELLNGRVTVEGRITVAGTLEMITRFVVNPGGLLQVDAGSHGVTVAGFLDVWGQLNLEPGFTDAGGNAVAGGALSVSSQIRLESGSTLSDAGTLTVGSPSNNFAVLNDDGTATITPASFDLTGHQTQPAGVLDLFGTINVDPDFTFRAPGGALNDVGQLTVEAGAVLNDSGTVAVGLPDSFSGELDLYGTLNVTTADPGVSSAGLLAVNWVLNVEPGNGTSPGVLNDLGQLTLGLGGQLTEMGSMEVDAGGTVSDQGRFWVTQASGHLRVEDAGKFTLSATGRLNTFQGGNTAIFGSLSATSADNRVTVDTGGLFGVLGTMTLTGSLDVAASGGVAGVFSVGPGSFDLSSGATATVEGTFTVFGGGTATVEGALSVAAGGNVNDQGHLEVLGAQGSLALAAASGGLLAALLTVDFHGGVLTLGQNASAMIAGDLEGDGTIDLLNGATLTDTGVVKVVNMDVAGPSLLFPSASFTIESDGLCVLLGTSLATVEGDFNVLAGTLFNEGVMIDPSLTISAGGNLAGPGTVQGDVNVSSGGAVTPGFAGLGTINTGSLSLFPGAAFNASIVSPAPFAFGQDKVTGEVSLGNATLNLTAGPGFSAGAGDQYVLISNDGTDDVGGHFVAGAGADPSIVGTGLSEGATVSADFLGSGRIARISYAAGTAHHSVAITLSPKAPTIDTAPADPSTSDSAGFAFSDVDSGVTFRVSLDGGQFVAATSPASFTGLTPGTHSVQVEAVDRAGDVSGSTSFVWTIGTPPTISSTSSALFEAGSPGSFTVTTTGFPNPTLTETGDLPTGITFVDQGDGTAVLAGNSPVGTFGTFPITINASNGLGTDAAQSFVLTISNLTTPGSAQVLSSPQYVPLSTLPALPGGAEPVLPAVTSFTVSQVTPGGTSTIIIQLPAGTLQPNTQYAYFKYDVTNSAWVRVNPGVARFDSSAQTVTLNLVDDGNVADGDEDAANSGTILDPGLPVKLATPTVHVVDDGGEYNGSLFPAVATVAGQDGSFAPTLEGVAPTLDYELLDAHGTVISDLHGQAPSDAGSYEAIASYPATAGYTFAQGVAFFTISQASQTITWHPPASIIEGSLLSALQLDATVAVVGPASAGVLTYSPPGGTLLGPGPRTLTVTAAATRDYKAATATVTLLVLYDFSGFLPPLSPSMNVQPGRTLPIQFALSDAAGKAITSMSAVTSLRIQQVNAQGSPIGSPFNPTATGNTTLRNDGGQYIFNWQTKGLAAGHYQIVLTLADGTTRIEPIDIGATSGNKGQSASIGSPVQAGTGTLSSTLAAADPIGLASNKTGDPFVSGTALAAVTTAIAPSDAANDEEGNLIDGGRLLDTAPTPPAGSGRRPAGS